MTAAALAEPPSVQRSDRTTQTPHHRPRLGTRELDPEQVKTGSGFDAISHNSTSTFSNLIVLVSYVTKECSYFCSYCSILIDCPNLWWWLAWLRYRTQNERKPKG